MCDIKFKDAILTSDNWPVVNTIMAHRIDL